MRGSRQRWWLGVMACLAAQGCGGGPAAPPCGMQGAVNVRVLQPAALFTQEQQNWCWVAVGQTILTFLGAPITVQCDVASRDPGLRAQCGDCCVEWDCCDEPAWPPFHEYGFEAAVWPGHLAWEQVEQQLRDRGQPFAFTREFVGGGSHMLAATGYVAGPSGRFVSVWDPAPIDGRGTLDVCVPEDVYDELPGAYDPGRTYHDFH